MNGPRRVHLDDIVESLDYGVTASAEWLESGPKFLRITDIQSGAVDWPQVPWCTCTAHEASERALRPGDIVFARTGATTGKSFLLRKVPEDAVFASYLIRIRLSQKADPVFISHFFNSDDYWNQINQSSRGAAQPGINASVLRALQIPLPPLEEQRRIAAILDKAHRITLLQKDAKNAIVLLPKSLFLSLFGDPRINPYSWPQYSLGELGRVVTGSTPPSSEHGMFEGTHPFVTPGDLGSGQASKRSLTEAGARRSRSVRKGSALVCCIGATIGKMDIAREDSAFNQQINAVEWGDSVIGEFGIEALRFFKDTISTAGASTTLPILKKSAFEKLRIPVPPIGLQRDYCRHLEAMSPSLARLQTAAQLGASLKQALMSKAFSGELLR